jgi:dimethylaniline monooxygenase (N-oxide forming)
MSHIAYERIAVRPGIAEVTGQTVRFVDGREESSDAIVAATGYEIDVGFLRDGTVTVEDRHAALYKRVLAPGWPGPSSDSSTSAVAPTSA